MSILIDKNTRVVTQGITGNTGQFHTRTSREYANGRECYVAGVNPIERYSPWAASIVPRVSRTSVR